METIYKTCSPKYTSQEISSLNIANSIGTVSFVSFERLLRNSVYEAIGLKPNEEIVGMKIDQDGITCYIETKK